MNLIEKQDIVDSNQKIINEWNLNHPEEQQVFCVRNGVLDEVFEIVEKTGDDDSNTQENLIQKTSYLMGAISWAQPFCDENKRTALLVIATIFYDHGYEFEPCNEDKI